MLSSYKKNIFCLESLWDGDVEQKLSVLPILEVTAKMNDIKFVHLSCNTEVEFRYNINLISRKKSYKVLYLAFHGETGKILLDDSAINLRDLAEIMKKKFKGWTIHFGSCSTLKAEDKVLREFVEKTGASLVTGYTKAVSWAESAALDMLLFCTLQSYKSPKYLGSFMAKTYPDLIELSGFRFFLKE